MKKLTLAIDTLEVESFTTAGQARPSGTVHGHVYTYDLKCPTVPNTQQAGCTAYGCVATNVAGGCTVYYCEPAPSGDATCLNTCGDGSECTLGETMWDNCTGSFKVCG